MTSSPPKPVSEQVAAGQVPPRPAPRQASRLDLTRIELDACSACLRLVASRSFGGEASVRRYWLRVLLRNLTRTLFEGHALTPPSDARLFQLEGDEAELEACFERNPAWQTCLRDSTAALSRISGCRTLDLPHRLGAAFELLGNLELDTGPEGVAIVGVGRNKRTGTFYTPERVAREVAQRALSELRARRGALRGPLYVCDPACGSGAFLLELSRELHREGGPDHGIGLPEVERGCEDDVPNSVVLCGVDLDPLAIAVCELCLWADRAQSAGPAQSVARLFAGNALTGRGFAERPHLSGPDDFDFSSAFADRMEAGFDLVIGNPPWVAFAGRAAQPLPPELRAFFARAYAGFRGYPTLQAAFVERALELAPRGVIALLIPSPIADLDGYRPIRRRLLATHVPAEPLLEFGQDAFSEVTQPCFALVATPKGAAASARTTSQAPSEPAAPQEVAPHRVWILAERPRLAQRATPLEIPEVLERLRLRPCLPEGLFGEMGLQTTKIVSERLLRRASAPSDAFTYPLLEGKDISEYHVGPVRLYLHPDPELLQRARCRLRSESEYQRVALVVRQTARAPIAALHNGLPFRNSLLAGFHSADLPAELVVGLLNSTLYRALHVSRQRDARQSTFPQVKLGHLRCLPYPPLIPSLWEQLTQLVQSISVVGLDLESKAAVDTLVFDLFAVEQADRGRVTEFLGTRSPELLRAARVRSNSG